MPVKKIVPQEAMTPSLRTTSLGAHKPCTVVERKDVAILWDMLIHTDKEIAANAPDVVIKEWKENKRTFIDIFSI